MRFVESQACLYRRSNGLVVILIIQLARTEHSVKCIGSLCMLGRPLLLLLLLLLLQTEQRQSLCLVNQ